MHGRDDTRRFLVLDGVPGEAAACLIRCVHGTASEVAKLVLARHELAPPVLDDVAPHILGSGRSYSLGGDVDLRLLLSSEAIGIGWVSTCLGDLTADWPRLGLGQLRLFLAVSRLLNKLRLLVVPSAVLLSEECLVCSPDRLGGEGVLLLFDVAFFRAAVLL